MTAFERADDAPALLVRLGYLGWGSVAREAFVPNKEVLEVFAESTRTPEWARAGASAVFRTLPRRPARRGQPGPAARPGSSVRRPNRVKP